MFKFASESSTHGVNYIFGENRSKFVRVLWIFLFCASFCGFSYYFKLSYTKWSVAPDITIKITNRLSKEFPMPAVTICPNLLARLNQLDIKKFYSATQEKIFINVSQAECEYFYANLNWCMQPYTYIAIKRHCNKHIRQLEELNVLEMINKSAYRNEELFSKKILNKFSRVNTFLGICFSYNMQDFSAIFRENIHEDFQCYKNQEHPKIEWNVERGYFHKNSTYPENLSKKKLKFATMMNPIDIINSCATKSVIVYLHLPSEMPNEHQVGLTLNYGSQTNIDIVVKSHRTNDNLRSYSPDIRKCYFDDEKKLEFFKSYTVSHCLVECKTNFMIKTCGCVSFWMPRTKITQVCRFSNMKCLSEMWDSMLAEDQFACGCLPSCNGIRYSFKMNSLSMDPTLFDLDQNNSIATMWMLNLKADYVVEIESFLAYTLAKFVSDVGGLLGLFLGCSFMSILEIFYFFIASLSKGIKNQNAKQNVVTTEDLKALNLAFDENINEHYAEIHERIKELFEKIDKFEKNFLNVEEHSE